jgi:hypothetical protein
MSHVAEVYAKDLGVKIGKPTITEHYLPNSQEVYACFDFKSPDKMGQYNYWDIVVSLVTPVLKKSGISLLQIPEASPKQKNFFIKKSVLYFGLANHNVNIADNYGVPSVSILSNVYESNFNLFDNATVLTPDFSKIKPSFSSCGRVNEIKPEQIAQAILDQLNIKEKIKFKTIKIGSNFNNKTVEVVPNFFGYSKQLEGKPVNIRGDLHFDLANIASWCKMCLVNLYIDSVFDVGFLDHMPNLKQVVFKHSQKDEDYEKFFKALKNRKINVIIQTKDKENISDLRLKYFDFNVIEETEPEYDLDAIVEITSAKQFISKKSFISNGETFTSESSAKRLDKSSSFVYDEVSKSELESLYIYDEE